MADSQRIADAFEADDTGDLEEKVEERLEQHSSGRETFELDYKDIGGSYSEPYIQFEVADSSMSERKTIFGNTENFPAINEVEVGIDFSLGEFYPGNVRYYRFDFNTDAGAEDFFKAAYGGIRGNLVEYDEDKGIAEVRM